MGTAVSAVSTGYPTRRLGVLLNGLVVSYFGYRPVNDTVTTSATLSVPIASE